MIPYGRGAVAGIEYTGDEAATEIKGLLNAVVQDEDSYDRWEALVLRASELEGGVTRNASPHAIELVRNVYDCFLYKFPLFFGYWKKYADLEFAIGGTETAEMVYERGVSAISTSVDLWTNYCAFKMETCHDNDIIRELFERAVVFVGLDFHSHPFWDKYIEFEERAQAPGSFVTRVCIRAALIPIHQSSSYYTRFLKLMEVRPFQEWVDPEYLSEVKATVDRENEGLPEKAPAEIERQLLAKINAYYHDAFTLTQEHVRDRWHFEQAIRRPYFHVTKLDDAELTNWHKYLDFEEKQRDYERIVFLYERCLVACALYPKFWIRYARWMFSQGKEENARIIYVRACTQFVPTHGINIRLKWARFEEKLGRVNVARDIHHAILNEITDHPKTILSLSGLIRRHEGVDMAVQTLDGYILRGAKNAGILVGEQARMLYYCKNMLEDARQAFIDKKDLLIACADFWLAWLKFEIDQPARFDREVRETDSEEVHSRVKAVYEQIPKFNFSPTVWKHMTSTYKRFLMSRGGPDVAEEYVLLDMWGAGYMQADVEESVTVSA